MQKDKKLFFAALLLTFAFVASYVNFQSYRPKSIRQVEDVKGLKTESDTSLPLPEDAQKVSVSRASESEQLTLYTNKTKEETQDFYKNIYISNRWGLASQGIYNDFIITRYTKENKQVTVITFDTVGEYTALVSLELTNL